MHVKRSNLENITHMSQSDGAERINDWISSIAFATQTVSSSNTTHAWGGVTEEEVGRLEGFKYSTVTHICYFMRTVGKADGRVAFP